MQNFIVEYAEPSILPRIHFNAEDKAKGAVDFLNTTFFNETSTTATAKLPERIAVQVGQTIQDLVPKAVDLANLLSPAVGSGEGYSSTTAPPPVSIRKTSLTAFQPVSSSQVRFLIWEICFSL
jgi:hypothetical protein